MNCLHRRACSYACMAGRIRHEGLQGLVWLHLKCNLKAVRAQALQRSIQARCAYGCSYTDALFVLLTGLNRFDADMLTVQALGVLESRAGNTKAARELFRQSLAADPGHAYAWQVRPPYLKWMGIMQSFCVDQHLVAQRLVTLQADQAHICACTLQLPY